MTDDRLLFQKMKSVIFSASMLRKPEAWIGRISLFGATKVKVYVQQGAQLVPLP